MLRVLCCFGFLASMTVIGAPLVHADSSTDQTEFCLGVTDHMQTLSTEDPVPLLLQNQLMERLIGEVEASGQALAADSGWRRQGQTYASVISLDDLQITIESCMVGDLDLQAIADAESL